MITPRLKKQTNIVILSIISAVLVLSVILAVAYLVNNRQSDKTGKTSNSSTSVDNSGSISSPKETSSTAPNISPDIEPTKPTGTFVSNHRPNLSGSPAPNTESSTCTTTPGAKCKITFSNNGVSKSLPTKLTDANGNVIWGWSLESVGLTAGDWVVSAIAINADKSSTTIDPINLTVRE